jgi:3-oxoadipate enol-lactonase
MPTVETNGIQTYYEEYGEGPPIVFLHGAWGDHRLWAEQVQSLTKDYRLIVYDLRGHGRTGGSAVDSYTIRLYVDDLNALITTLDLDKPAICGRSMGGFVALTYAATYPDTISALCTLGAETPEAQTRGEWLEWQIRPKLINALSVVIDRDRLMAVIHRINEWRYDPRGAGDMEKIERILQSHAEDVPESSEEESTKIRKALESYSSASIDYSSIVVPSLILYGEYEIPLIRRHAKYMEKVIPHAEAGQIPNAGHVSTVDNPEFVVTSLRKFLAS